MTSATPPADAPPGRPTGAARPQLRVIIVTGDRIVYDGPADAVAAQGSRGVITVLLHHAPMLTMLELGELVIHNAAQTASYLISGGFMRVADDSVTVLAEDAERPQDIDLDVAEADVRDAKALVKRYRSRPEVAALALRRAQVRLRAARKARARPGV